MGGITIVSVEKVDEEMLKKYGIGDKPKKKAKQKSQKEDYP